MQNITPVQSALLSLYNEYLDMVYADNDLLESLRSFRISSPLLLSVDARRGRYLDSSLRVLYVGKENNGWFNERERQRACVSEDLADRDQYVTALLALYREFNIGAAYRRPIFTFLDLLISTMREDHEDVGFLWTNLLRHDAFESGSVLPSVIAKITYDNNYVFRRELQILKPDAVVFVTGPSYDNILQKTFPDLHFEAASGFSNVGEFAVIKADSLPCKAVRVYHPDAHKWRGADYPRTLSKAIWEHIRAS